MIYTNQNITGPRALHGAVLLYAQLTGGGMYHPESDKSMLLLAGNVGGVFFAAPFPEGFVAAVHGSGMKAKLSNRAGTEENWRKMPLLPILFKYGA